MKEVLIMKKVSYIPEQVCAKEINFELEGNIVTNVEFVGGCPGNALGLVSLVKGMEIEKVIEKLQGILCRNRATSCPDQLTKALREHVQI
jgi:uncharacterized protein (TIGR03905 family)